MSTSDQADRREDKGEEMALLVGRQHQGALRGRHLTEGWARRKDPFLSPAPLAAREIPLVMYKFNFIPRHQTAHLSSTGGGSLEPSGHLKSLANWGRLARTTFTRYGDGEWPYQFCNTTPS